MAGFRSVVLTLAGATSPVLWWASRNSAKYGVRVRRGPHAIELTKQQNCIRLTPKHVFFAPLISRNFDTFFGAMTAELDHGIATVDFAVDPHMLSIVKFCLHLGVKLEARDGTYWLQKDRRVMILAARHLVYATGMARDFDVYFSPLIPEERDGLLVLDYSRPGIVHRYAKSGLAFEMASFPEEEDAIEQYFRWYTPKPGDLVFDIGAHCGVSSYHLSKQVGPTGRVVCFEPDPVNFAILQRNVERHGLTNVLAINIAIAGEIGELAFNSEGTIGSSLKSLLLRESVGSTVTVDAITLSEAFERFGTPAFCKIDIEGAEIRAIASAKHAIQESGTFFAVDTHHPRQDGTMTNREIEDLFRNFGYDATSEACPFWTTWARPLAKHS